MAAKKTDISQIKDYLEGGLDARAMNQMERQTQDDPFLMDALDGYSNTGMPPQSTFDDLDYRLQQRLDKGRRGRIIKWRYIAAAASLFIIFSVAYLMRNANQQPLQKRVLTAQQITPPLADHAATTSSDTIVKPALKKKLLTSVVRPDLTPAQDRSTTTDEQATANTTNATGQVVVNAPPDAKPAAVRLLAKRYEGQADKVTGKDSLAPLKEVSITGLAKLSPKDIETNAESDSKTLQGKVSGLNITTPQKISGTVLNDLGLALPGVYVKLEGTDIVTLTDEKGRFTIPANGQSTLDIEQSGFAGKSITAKANDSIRVELHPVAGEVNPVTAVKDKPVKAAHPQMGRKAYDRFLQAQAISNDGHAGVVRIVFTVSAGEGGHALLSDFKIIKGLSAGTDQQAINLIKNGPAWAPNVNGKPQIIKLKVTFSKKPDR